MLAEVLKLHNIVFILVSCKGLDKARSHSFGAPYFCVGGGHVYSIHPLVKARRRHCICADMINGDGELVAGTTNPMP
jgi:hypothetical protein